MSAVEGWSWRCTKGTGAVTGHVGGVVPVGGVPAVGEGLAGEHERDGALDGAGGAVAGLPGAVDLLGVFYRDFNAPPRRVTLDDMRRSGVQVGGDQGQVVPGRGAVPDEHDLDLARAQD
jgi:hypothetical protein